METELFDIVDENDRVIGQAPRRQCHGDPALVHRAAHVLLFNSTGELLLQKRAENKDIQPNKWDTSVGGHLDPGEDYKQAAIREMKEELGVEGIPITFLYHSRIRNEIESENIATYLAIYDGEVFFEPREITDVRFWKPEEISCSVGTGIFTPNFEQEWRMYNEWQRRYPAGENDSRALCSGDSFPDLVKEINVKNG